MNPFHANASFLYSQRTSKSSGFLMFSGGLEKIFWPELLKFNNMTTTKDFE